MSIYQNARVYWEMYGGVEPEGNDQHVQALNLNMDVGGWAADDYAYFQVSVYGRKNVNSPNLATLYRAPIHRPTGSIMWTPVRISERITDTDVRCIVVKVELIEALFTAPDGTLHPLTYSDQYQDADAPPWGIRIHEASLYCSDLVRDVRAHRVFADILAGRGFTYSGPVATWTPDQLDFTDIPYDRQDAIDDVNGMLGWNYACWDGTEVEFALPKSGTAHVIAASDPRTTWSVEESLDETYNAVRVCYGNKSGKPREVIVHGSTAALRGTVRADTLQAPESIKSEKAATRFAKRYLASHETKQVAGSVSIQGIMPAVPHVVTARRPVGTVPGAVLELLASAAKDGTGPGVNSPLTTTWTDLSGNGNHGTLTGFGGETPWAGAGSAGDPYRLVFDPTAPGDYIACPDLGAAEDKVFTYEAWIQTTGSGEMCLFCESAAGMVPASEFRVTARKLSFMWWDAGWGGVACASAASVGDGLLHHVVATSDGSFTKLFIDGADTGAQVAVPAGALAFMATEIGRLWQTDYYYFAGSMPVARIYPFALTPEQVAQNYAAGLATVDTLAMTSDPLLIRPGDTVKMTGPARSLSGTHEITRVTLRPLEWTADVEFGTNSKRFDTWLARLAAGAKSIKRR